MEDICRTLLDMILLEPVNWVSVQTSILSTAKQALVSGDTSCEILNFGPGYGMSRSKQSLPESVRILDASSGNSGQPIKTPLGTLSNSDIAIVGMGVDLPGAPDAATLWVNLCEGISTCSEVS